jgi:ubiquitin-protein ligase
LAAHSQCLLNLYERKHDEPPSAIQTIDVSHRFQVLSMLTDPNVDSPANIDAAVSLHA